MSSTSVNLGPQQGVPEARWVNVVKPSGEVVAVPSYDLPKLMGAGWRIESPGERSARKAEEDHGGTLNELAAGAAGAARMATLGFSDQLMVRTGLVSPDKLSSIKAQNPMATLTGEIGGVAGSMVAGGRGGSGGLVGRISRAGAAAERQVAARMPQPQSLAGRLLTKATIKGGGAAVEGAAYGAGQLISEDALGEADLTAQNLIAYSGAGALFGAGVGGVFGAGGELARTVTKGVGGVASGAVERLYRGGTGAEPAKGLGKAYAKGAAVLTGAPEDDIAKLMADPWGTRGKAVRMAATGGQEVKDKAARDLAGLANEVDDFVRSIGDEWRGKAKLRNVDKVIRTGNEEQVRAVARRTLDDIRGQFQGILDEPGIHGTWGVGKAKRALKLIDDMEARLYGRTAEAGTQAEIKLGTVAGRPKAKKKAAKIRQPTNAEVFEGFDVLKRKLAKMGAKPGQFASSQDNEAVAVFRGVYDDRLKSLLEDFTLFGQAGAMQKAVNAKFHQFLNVHGVFRSRFMSKIGQEGWDPKHVVDPGKIESFLGQITGAKGDLSHQALRDTLRAQEELLEAIGKNVDLGGSAINVGKAHKAASQLRVTLKDIEEKVALQNQLLQLDSASREVGELVGGGLGAAVGGVPGAVLGGAVVGAAMRPSRVVRSLAVLERMTGDVGTRVKSAVKRLGAKAGKLARTKTATEITQATAKRQHRPAVPVAHATMADRRDEYDRRAKRIASIANDPAAAGALVKSATAALDGVAPKVSEQLATRAMAGAAFLYARMPKDPRGPKPEALGSKWQPPDVDVSKWLRYANAIEDPLAAVENLAEGKISREQVEALREVYPGVYDQMRQQLMEHVSQLEERLPYRDRVNLSILFEAPLDDTMRPEFLSAMRDAANTPQGPQPSATGGPVNTTMPQRLEPAASRISAV